MQHDGTEAAPQVTPFPDGAASRLCSVAGCGRGSVSRGLCNGHYLRWYRHGDVRAHIPLASTRAPEPCSEPGCDQPSRGKKLCSVHYSRYRRSRQRRRRPKKPRTVLRCDICQGDLSTHQYPSPCYQSVVRLRSPAVRRASLPFPIE